MLRYGGDEGKKVSWALITYQEADSVDQARAAEADLSRSHGLVVRMMDKTQASKSTGAMDGILKNRFVELAKTRKKQRLEQGLQRTVLSDTSCPAKDTTTRPAIAPPPLPLALPQTPCGSNERLPTKPMSPNILSIAFNSRAIQHPRVPTASHRPFFDT